MHLDITLISDLHGFLPKLEGGDLLIIAGDITDNDKGHGWHKFFDWLDNQKYRKKVMIAGNHDNFCKNWAISGTFTDDEYDQMYPEEKITVDYLCDWGTEFEGLKIWGSPWTTKFKGMNPKCRAFTVDHDLELKEKWDLIPNDIDILITHSPPYGILDENIKCEHCGSKSLLKAIQRIHPRLVIYGHLHEFGMNKKMQDDILFVNSSFVDEKYKPRNKFMKCHYQDSLFTAFLTPTPMK